jgi:hypothetical protein
MENKELCSAVLAASIVSAEQQAIQAGPAPEPHTETEIIEPVARPDSSISESGGSRGGGLPYGMGPCGAVITSSRDGNGDGEKMLVGEYGA